MDQNMTPEADAPEGTTAPEIPAHEPERDLRSEIVEAVAQQRAKAAPEQTEPEQGEQPKADRARDEAGRFAKPAEQPKVEEKPEAAPVEPAATEAPAAHKPPPGWSPAAKVAFDKLPAEVKEAVSRREVEINAGFAKLAEYKGLEPLADLARQNGTTLTAAVQQYRQFEVALQSDFMGGIGYICQRFGVDPRSLAQAIMTRSGQGQQSAQPHQNAQQADLSPVLQRLQQLEGENKQRRDAEVQRREAELQAEIQKFSSENRFFENVRHVAAGLLRSGLAETLQDAYRKACQMDPEIGPLLINEQRMGSDGAASAQKAAAAVDQARRAAKAVSGAPAHGARPDAQRMPENASTREIIQAAIAAQRGRA